MKPGIAIVFAATLLINGCILYVPNVEQGNILSKEMIDKVQVGQSQQQVRFLLGSPLIHDAFHENRWDYVYTMKKGRSKKVENKRLTIIFNNGVVSKVIREG